jgi:hypothetical protein
MLLSIGCASGSPVDVEAWYLDGYTPALVRKQENARLTMQRANGYICFSPDDTAELMSACYSRGVLDNLAESLSSNSDLKSSPLACKR